MRLTSDAFLDGQPMPTRHTRDGADESPPLFIGDVPVWARELVVLVVDPDAPIRPFTHWVLHGLGPSLRRLPPALLRAPRLPGGGRQGRNDYGGVGWGGPSPPPGLPHRYVFTLHAVDRPLSLPEQATAADVHAALAGRLVERATLIGTYRR